MLFDVVDMVKVCNKLWFRLLLLIAALAVTLGALLLLGFHVVFWGVLFVKLSALFGLLLIMAFPSQILCDVLHACLLRPVSSEEDSCQYREKCKEHPDDKSLQNSVMREP